MQNRLVDDRMLASLYRAAVEPAQWADALDDVIAAIGGVAARFVLGDQAGLQGGARMHIAGIYDETARQLYLDRYHALDPRPQLLARLRPGTVVVSHHHFDEDYVRGSEFFSDFLIPRGARHSMSCELGTGRLAADFCVSRNERQGRFEDDDNYRYAALVPHLQNAARLYDLTRRSLAQQPFALAALDQLRRGVVIVDVAGHVVYANPAAERIAAQRDGLSLQSAGVMANLPAENARLTRLIRRAGEARDLTGGAMSIARPSGRPGYRVAVTPLLAATALHDDARTGAALVMISDSDGESDGVGAALAGLFRLTAAEERLAVAVIAGRRLSEVCAESGLRISTLRAQLRAVFRKTGTGRQAELIRLAKDLGS